MDAINIDGLKNIDLVVVVALIVVDLAILGRHWLHLEQHVTRLNCLWGDSLI